MLSRLTSALVAVLWVMFICYLDDSDSSISQVATLGGYVATEDNWRTFEAASKKLFLDFEVKVYQTKIIVQSKKCFHGWDREKKLDFIDKWSNIAAATVTFGTSIATRRSFHKKFIKENPKNSQMSAYGISFSAIMHMVASNNPLRDVIRQNELSFVVEEGNSNNREIELFFHAHKSHPAFMGALKDISFAKKNSSFAIQFADFCAYHSRRILASTDRLGQGFAVPAQEHFEVAYGKLLHLMKSINHSQSVNDAGIEIERVTNPEVSELWKWLSRPH